MATFTVNVMGVEQEKNLMTRIIQTVRTEGKYELEIKNRVGPEDLMANKLVAFKVLTRQLVRNFPRKADVYEYSAGENFAEADVKGAYKYIEEEKKRLDPSYLVRSWNKISNNALIAGVVGTVIGFLISLILS